MSMSEQLSAAQLERIKAATLKILDNATSFLAKLVQVDTTNPPGLAYREVALVIQTELDALGYRTELLTVPTEDLPALAPHDKAKHERVNVIGRKLSSSASPSLVGARQKTLHFNGHTDVVPAGDLSTWSHPPFGAEIHPGEDGSPAMYGRGVSDMKGGIAAGVWAIEALKAAGLVLRGAVEHSGCVDEESTGIRNAGAGWLVEAGHVTPEKVDAVVITEPLNVENVCLGHRGAIWGTITFKGRASHGATPQRGINALVHAARFIVKADAAICQSLSGKRDERVIPEEARAASLTFTVLDAGANTNSVPDLATLKFDRRLVPEESLAEARAQIHAVLEELKEEVPELVYEYEENYSTEPIWVDQELELARAWRGAVKSVVGEEAGVVCSPGSDDQRFFVRGGIEQTIVYGPGHIRQVHCRDEHLPLEDLRKAIEVMAIGAAEFLGFEEA